VADIADYALQPRISRQTERDGAREHCRVDTMPETTQTTVIDDEDRFLALQSDWDSLYAVQENRLPAASFSSAWSAWERIARPNGRKLRIIVARRAGRLVLVFPLVLQRAGPVRIGRWLGPDFGEYCDVLVEPLEGWEQRVADAWSTSALLFDLIRLPVVREDAKLRLILQTARLQKADTEAPYIDCRRWENWSHYYSCRSKSHRKDLREARSRLQRLGETRIVVVDRTVDMIAALEWIVAEKCKDPKYTAFEEGSFAHKRSFYFDFCRKALLTGELVIVELWVGDIRAAAQWSIRIGDQMYAQMLAWDQEMRRCGPGRLIADETIRWAFDNGIAVFDLGIGRNEYKLRFTDTGRAVDMDMVVALRSSGRLLLAGIAVVRCVNRVLRRLSALWATRSGPGAFETCAAPALRSVELSSMMGDPAGAGLPSHGSTAAGLPAVRLPDGR
jgi:CelD/BcsL family acetyltransferase involved in cellulose biosynthesis